MISHRVLGHVGRDNAVWCRVETGQHIQRLLFDCGHRCVDTLAVAEAHDVDMVFFSHLHMDHIAGFDELFRLTFNRLVKPNIIYGPAETAQIIQHRMQGFRWSHVDGHPARWWLHDILEHEVQSFRVNLGERFAHLYPRLVKQFSGWLEFPQFRLRVFHLQHGTIPSLGYLVQEHSRLNIDKRKLLEHNLPAGPWLQQVKDSSIPAETVIPIEGTKEGIGDGKVWTLGALRDVLLYEQRGASFAYLSDFYLSDEEIPVLAAELEGCDTLVCESQYLHEDEDFAQRNAHMTCTRVARLAAAAQVKQLVLFHVSERYRVNELYEMLAQARAIFANTNFPKHWRIA